MLNFNEFLISEQNKLNKPTDKQLGYIIENSNYSINDVKNFSKQECSAIIVSISEEQDRLYSLHSYEIF